MRLWTTSSQDLSVALITIAIIQENRFNSTNNCYIYSQLTVRTGRRSQNESTLRQRIVPSGPVVARPKARSYSLESALSLDVIATCSHSRIPAAIKSSNNFLIKIGAGDFAELVPKIKRALEGSALLESMTV